MRFDTPDPRRSNPHTRQDQIIKIQLARKLGLGTSGRHAFVGAFGGYALDSYDYQVLPLGLVAIAASLRISTGEAGLLTTVTLVLSAVGGVVAGILIDRIGRVRTLLFTIITYAVFTVLCGFAPNFESLLVLRALQGLGFGGEWAAGAILVAEYCSPRYRGRTVGFIQSSWAVGWALSVVVATAVFSLASPQIAWRLLFWTGALPALLVFYLRRQVTDAPIVVQQAEPGQHRGSFGAIFGRHLGRTTFFAALLTTGVQGGYYTLFGWLPSYLTTQRHLTVVGTEGYLMLLISGAFVGYITGSYLTDLLGRKLTIALFATLSAVLIFLYTHVPTGANTIVLILGFPLGWCTSAIFSGFGSFLAELYPTAQRGTGQGFTYNVGRALGAVFPTLVGFLAGSWGLGGAMVLGALAYGLAALALLGLPETRGRDLL
ncbi:MAG: MFS transporter [Actinomycetota bacterium]|nr:MFS transporter [Actinomycetota bacterium]